jgi:lysyl-tRNA synthetase class 1
MQVPMERYDASAGTVVWRDPESGETFETSVKGGGCKLQWKADWAMRWHALGVDYEMSGKDLIDSVRLSGRICRILGSTPPEGFTYELFLDEHAQKISKSRGNGLSVEEWLRYAPPESLSQFMFTAPHRAKRLYFDVIPRAADEYLVNAARLQTGDKTNPAWHIHAGRLPNHSGSPVSFGMLLNLASVVNAETPAILWGFIRRYSPNASPETMPFLDRLVDHAIAYYRDFVRPEKRYRHPTEVERAALVDLAETLKGLDRAADAEAIQTIVYEVGKRHPLPDLRAWFGCLYQVLLGQQEGPRFGGFVSLYGIEESIALIEAALARPADAA